MKLLAKFKKKRPDQRLQYWKTIDGHKIYSFVSLQAMPQTRHVMVKIGLEKLGLGVRPVDSKAFLKTLRGELEKYVVESNSDELDESLRMQNIYHLLSEYEYQLSNFASARLVAEVGGYGIIVDDEPLNELSPAHNKVKEKLLVHPEVYAFFFDNMKAYATKLRSELTDYLDQKSFKIKEREEIFLERIGESEFSNLWKTPTQK